MRKLDIALTLAELYVKVHAALKICIAALSGSHFRCSRIAPPAVRHTSILLYYQFVLQMNAACTSGI